LWAVDARQSKEFAMAKKDTDLSKQALALAEFASSALIGAEKLGIKNKAITKFPLNDLELEFIFQVCNKPKSKKKGKYTIAEVAGLLMDVADSLYVDGKPQELLRVLVIANQLVQCLRENISQAISAMDAKAKTTGVFQFKITLLEIEPSIWRRIQVEDCTLDQFHEHIQTALGWTNSHLHQFEIKGKKYGDPELLDDGFGDLTCIDSTETMLSDILPKSGNRFSFEYQYDMGDSWVHEIQFEGTSSAEPKVKYPICLEGQRACPPEDCGGTWGYSDFLAAIKDKKHEQHKEMLEWVGGKFDPEKFDAATATKMMKKGLPDWRSMS